MTSSKLKITLNYVILPIISSYIIFNLGNYFLIYYSPNSHSHNIFSSVRCFGYNSSNRQCIFNQLCYHSKTNDFVFVFDANKSLIVGVPDNRFRPPLLDLSSVADHNNYYFNYIEIPSESFKQFSKTFTIETIEKPTILFARFKPDNIMHTTHDDVLPLFHTIKKFGYDDANIIFADEWPRHSTGDLQFNDELYRTVFRSSSIMHVKDISENALTCFSNLHVGLDKTTIWYDYGFFQHQHPLPKSIVETERIRRSFKEFTGQVLSEGVKIKCDEKYTLLVSRGYTRKILNEDELITFISFKTDGKVLTVDLESDVSFQTLAKKFHCASIIISMHGSALIFALFAKKGTKILELFPYAINPEKYSPYKRLAELQHLQYKAWANMRKENSVQHPYDYTEELGGVSHLPIDQQIEIINTQDVPDHLCCDYPNWLFHINQDTYIDIIDFGTAFHELLINVGDQSLFAEKIVISPGPIIDPICTRDSSNHIFRVTWQPPWNIEYMDTPDIVYEIVIKDVYSVVSNHFSNETAFSIHSTDKCFIWIACRANKLQGPFLTKPLIC